MVKMRIQLGKVLRGYIRCLKNNSYFQDQGHNLKGSVRKPFVKKDVNSFKIVAAENPIKDIMVRKPHNSHTRES